MKVQIVNRGKGPTDLKVPFNVVNELCPRWSFRNESGKVLLSIRATAFDGRIRLLKRGRF